uniref:Uncharacterized protein n=1 Tax=Arion vulgaris TaxID=1028688 RepID=A0A0B7B0T5_9EUPU
METSRQCETEIINSGQSSFMARKSINIGNKGSRLWRFKTLTPASMVHDGDESKYCIINSNFPVIVAGKTSK